MKIETEVIYDANGRLEQMAAWAIDESGKRHESRCRVVPEERGDNDEETVKIGLRACRDDVEFFTKTGAYA